MGFLRQKNTCDWANMEVGVDKPAMGAGALAETFGYCHAWNCSIYTRYILGVFNVSDTLSR